MFGNLFKGGARNLEAMARVAAALGRMEVTGQAGGGAVTAKMRGMFEVTELRISDSLKDRAVIEDLAVAALNDANRKLREKMEQELPKMMGGASDGAVV